MCIETFASVSQQGLRSAAKSGLAITVALQDDIQDGLVAPRWRWRVFGPCTRRSGLNPSDRTVRLLAGGNGYQRALDELFSPHGLNSLSHHGKSGLGEFQSQMTLTTLAASHPFRRLWRSELRLPT